MNNFKRIQLIGLAILTGALFLWITSLSAEEKKTHNVSFHWAFGALVGSKNDQRLVAITRDTVLKTGDRIKMLIQLEKKCFVYLFYRTGQDDIHMLFPDGFSQFAGNYRVAEKYYIPAGEKWFELDDQTGLETFYLLASAQRLVELEQMYEKYAAGQPDEKKVLSQQFLSKIRQIRKKNRKANSTAERPVPIGGNVRGISTDVIRTPDIDPIADEVSAPNFYSRTFTIDHR
jgi:hypothetical protein